MKKGIWRETLLIVSLFVLFFSAGAAYYSRTWKTWGSADFYPSSILPPAVMMACGHGLGTHVPRVEPYPIDAFLLQQSQIGGFDCDSIPPGTVAAPLFDFQYAHFYMIVLFGAFWSIFGISWTNLWGLFGLYYAATALAAYGLFRVLLRRTPATLLTLWFAFSPVHLLHLPSFRDYSKAIFIIVTLAGAGLIVLSERAMLLRRRWLMPWLLGAVVGVGYRFRSDVLLCVPFCLLLFLALGSRTPMQSPFWRRLSPALIYVLGFLCLAYVPTFPWSKLQPHVWGDQIGGNLLHGQISNQVRALGVQVADYEIGNYASDAGITHLASSYSERIQGKQFETVDPRSDNIKSLFVETLKLFPADYVTKAAASILTLLKLPFLTIQSEMLEGSFLAGISLVVRKGLQPLGWVFRLVVILSFLLIFSLDVRRGFFLLLSAVFFLGYPSLRFQERHFFQMEVIPLLLFGCLISGLIAVRGMDLVRRREWRDRLVLVAKRGVVAATVFSFAFWGMRLVQAHGLEKYSRTLSLLPRSPLELSTDGAILQVNSARLPPHSDPFFGFKTSYIGLALSARECRASKLSLRVLYNVEGEPSLTRLADFKFEPGVETATYYFPTYRYEGVRFKGIDLLGHPVGCVQSVFLLEDVPPLSFLLSFKVFGIPARKRLFQEFGSGFWFR